MSVYEHPGAQGLSLTAEAWEGSARISTTSVLGFSAIKGLSVCT